MIKVKRGLLGLSLAICAVIAAAVDVNGTLLVGEHKLSRDTLSAKLKGLATIVEVDKGFFRVAPVDGKTLADVRSALVKAKIKMVMPGTASEVNRSDMKSVKEHIAFKRGVEIIATGKVYEDGDIQQPRVGFYEALEFYLSVRTDPNGELNRDHWIAGANHRDQMPAARMDMIDPDFRQSNAPVGTWSNIGTRDLDFPYQQYYGGAPLSGRKNGVHLPPANLTGSYLASAGGGIWASTDNSVTFSPKSDSWKFLHTTSVTTDPGNANTVYAGTGDYYGFFTAQTFGIMKSTNGGTTWANYGAALFGSGVVTRILVDPLNTTRVIATVADGGVGDIYRSLDSGLTWAATAAVNANYQDLEVSASGITKYACAASGKHLRWSNDGGANWNQVVGVPVAAGGSLWDIAVSQVQFDRIYLICSNRKVYRITGATGATPVWTDLTAAHDAASSNAGYNWSQSTYDIYIECGIDGQEDIVYTGLISQQASDDNGATWADIARSFETNSKMHNDQHCYEMDPNPAGNGAWGISGGDGGAWGTVYSPATNTATYTSLNDDILDTQFYTGTVHPTNAAFCMGGTQDNATAASRGNFNDWKNLYAGDGTGVGFDLINPARHYTGAQGGAVFRYDSDFDTTPVDISPAGGYLFVSPLICAGSYAVHGGSSSIQLNLNGTSGWTNRATGGGSIRHLEKSKWTNDRIYTGATNGDMYRHIISSNTTGKIDGATLPNASVGGFTESYFSTDHIIAGLQRVGVADVAYRSTNVNTATPVWSNISGAGATALPMMPVNDMERDPWNATVYYAATDVGVFMSPDAGVKWYNMNAMGLPNVHVNELWVYDNGASKYLYAFTFGRGVWRIFLGNRFINTFVLNKTDVYGGETVVGTIGLNGSASQNAACSVTDNSTFVITPGTSAVVVPQGGTSKSFLVYTSNPTTSQFTTLTARMYANEAAGSKTVGLTVRPIPSFVYNSSLDNVYGGNSFIATVTLGAPALITTTILFSDTSTFITSPTSSSIAVGGTSRSVILGTFSVRSTVAATINAKISTVTRTDTVNVQPKPELASIACSPNPVKGGFNTTGTVTLASPGLAGNILVTISDTSALVTTPANTTVIGGATTSSFSIATAIVRANTNVTVNGSYNGVTRSTVLVLTP